MALNDKYQIIFEDIYQYYNQNIFDISFFPFQNIYYTDNISKDIFLFCSKNDIKTIEMRGVTILPNDLLEDIIILIDISEENVTSYAECAIHEFTHIYDFKKFADKFCNGQYKKLESHNLFETYRQWSEFRAHTYGVMFSYKFIDNHFHTNNFDIIMKDYEENLQAFLLRERKKVIDHQFDYYDLSKDLSAIYVYDNYNDVDEIEHSCIYKYLPLLFYSDIVDQIYPLYELYLDSLKKQNIFENLTSIKTVEEMVY